MMRFHEKTFGKNGTKIYTIEDKLTTEMKGELPGGLMRSPTTL